VLRADRTSLPATAEYPRRPMRDAGSLRDQSCPPPQATEHDSHGAQGGLGADAAGLAEGDELRRDLDEMQIDIGTLEVGCVFGMTELRFARRPAWAPLAIQRRTSRRCAKVYVVRATGARRLDLDAPVLDQGSIRYAATASTMPLPKSFRQ
jgi:hypothetical protein